MSASTGTTVAVLVGALVVLGLAMVGVAAWLIRSTRADPPALGPLEVMGERRWRRGDADRRRTNLDTARPQGAPAPAPMVALEPVVGDGEGDGDGEADAAGDAAGDSEENSDSSAAESTRSGHSSLVEAPTVAEPARVDEPAAEADTKE
jgi:hypothetical protein